MAAAAFSYAQAALLCLDRINQLFCELLESGPKPTVAAVAGMALGGGLEVAMACNARVASPGEPLGAFAASIGNACASVLQP